MVQISTNGKVNMTSKKLYMAFEAKDSFFRVVRISDCLEDVQGYIGCPGYSVQAFPSWLDIIKQKAERAGQVLILGC